MGKETPSSGVVRASHLTKVFRDFWHRPKVRAVNGLDLDIRAGEIFGLLGPNGSGKSTTLKMILGLLDPTAGHLEVFGMAPRDVRTREHLGYMPEESCLHPYLTAEETLRFFARLSGIEEPRRSRQVEELLEMTGLQHARRRPVGEFSKGMARRIALAQALLNDPDLLLLDEPTSGLDPIGCRQVKDLIRTLSRRGRTVIISSHLLADMEDVCDRVAILYSGRVCAAGRVTDLLEQPDRCRFTLEGLPPAATEAIRDLLRRETGIEPAVDHPADTLEQFFIRTVQREQSSSVPTGARTADAIAPYLAPRKAEDERRDR